MSPICHSFPSWRFDGRNTTLSDVLRKNAFVTQDHFLLIQISGSRQDASLDSIPFTRSDGSLGTRYHLKIEDTVGAGLTDRDSEQAAQIWQSILVAVSDFQEKLRGSEERDRVESAECLRESLRPLIKSKRKSYETLSTMSLLCQGYLAAAELTVEPGPANGSGHVADALVKMGWSDIEPDELGLSKQSSLPRSTFWLSPFGESSLDDIETLLKAEWGGDLPEKVKTLVDNIGTGDQVVEREIVAEAYLAFHKRLESVP